jgi:hypothetical protein
LWQKKAAVENQQKRPNAKSQNKFAWAAGFAQQKQGRLL